MKKVNDPKIQDLLERVYQSGQGHIFDFWAELNPAEQRQLLHQIRHIDFEVLERLIELGLNPEDQFKGNQEIEPARVITLEQRREWDEEAKFIGEKALRDGQVAAFIVAGGQGSRLGFEGPKGCFPISPVKNKTLFQLHSEKIRAVSRKYNTTIPWYIMTSETNHDDTIQFFEEHHFFGLQKENVYFFRQDMLPAIDQKGKLILSRKHEIFENPNGHGGSIKALMDSGAVSDMEDRGIKYLFYFQVDNVLINMCDPVFLGYHIKNDAEMSNKVIRKTDPEEKVGIICRLNGKAGVVEYSDLDKENMYARAEDGRLVYWAGSIAIHCFNVGFIRRENAAGFKLPYHRADKKIPYIDGQGKRIKPEKSNGIKFETFVFDALADTDRAVTLEVDRALEFSAVKNEDGKDSPKTARAAMIRDSLRMLAEAGVNLPENDKNPEPLIVEISPLFALDSADIRKNIDKFSSLENNFYIE